MLKSMADAAKQGEKWRVMALGMTLRSDERLPLQAHPCSLHQVQVGDYLMLHQTLACMGTLQPKVP